MLTLMNVCVKLANPDGRVRNCDPSNFIVGSALIAFVIMTGLVEPEPVASLFAPDRSVHVVTGAGEPSPVFTPKSALSLNNKPGWIIGSSVGSTSRYIDVTAL